MLKVLPNYTAIDLTSETCRHAYNGAFEELGLNWNWDAATFARIHAQGQHGVRAYLEAEQSHLLRAYEVDFLLGAIETAKDCCYASIARCRERPTPSLSWTHQSRNAADGSIETGRMQAAYSLQT